MGAVHSEGPAAVAWEPFEPMNQAASPAWAWWRWQVGSNTDESPFLSEKALSFDSDNPVWISRIKQWREHHVPPGFRANGIRPFFTSALACEWVVFFIILVCFSLLHVYLVDWPSTHRYYSMALLIWLSVAGVNDLVVWDRLGPGAGKKWLSGYFLELVFSIENVFIFNVVMDAFKTPKVLAQKALFIVVCCQVIFQMVFFMGLAGWLQSMRVLPYLLGVWLVYVGIATARSDDHGEFDLEGSPMLRAFESCLGDRLSLKYHDGAGLLVEEDGRTKVTLLGPAIACLLLADFIMEVDVTLTKIEEIQNHYIAFTSSVAAAFAVPTLFFVARDFFQRYALLKYGITFVLMYYGIGLLLHQFIHIPDTIGIFIITGVLVFCVILSRYLELSSHAVDLPAEHESEEPSGRGCNGQEEAYTAEKKLRSGFTHTDAITEIRPEGANSRSQQR